MLTSHYIDGWYATAHKVPWNSPNFVFAPVLTLLYIVIGIAGWKLWQNSATTGNLMTLYWVQLVLNAV
ncbi:TspO/MBR family protein [Rothia sp. ZJ1223]|uniref:TspO/MBR family protein n=1 Tax=Rothia sp. ZJ1223 TaxID=2811098 RepID=UPI00195EC294|nr:TspO/MBR family protein [Rothia sp. ZJ1223]MBM7051781.1 tryptophan-rich sensory protein [Rothia sp. ZJ1223]